MENIAKKRLFVCCDGTWNCPAQREFGLLAPTNVVKFSNTVQQGVCGDVEQRVYYHPGVGSSDRFWDRVLGGAFGTGLGRNIKSAYKWLCDNYSTGDEIFIVGFSRGAFTARSLVGMLSHAGLIGRARWDQVDAAFLHYQARKSTTEIRSAQQRFEQFRAVQSQNTDAASTPHLRPPIQFLGVWDTVGTMGIPQASLMQRMLEKWWPQRSNRFHDLTLSSLVRCARHALGIDEQRQPFNVSLWESEPSEHQSIEQVWFPGIHSDVGGGFITAGLSDTALRWMLVEAEKQGAVLNPHMLAQLRQDDCHAPMHDAMTAIYNLVGARPRSLPALVEKDTLPAAAYGQRVHESALQRIGVPPMSDAPYRPTLLLQPGERCRFSVYARSYWNAPGVFLRAGHRYVVQASGTWQSAGLTYGPDGAGSRGLQWFFGWLRRVPEAPWCALIASIAHARNPDHSNTLTPFPSYLIGAQAMIEPQTDGYVYFFANDMTGLYGNNNGSVEVELRRLPDEITAHAAAQPNAKMLALGEPDVWVYVARWIGSAAALALCGYALLWGMTALARHWPWLSNMTSSSGWRWLFTALPLVVVALVIFYMHFFGRSDTRVSFVPSQRV